MDFVTLSLCRQLGKVASAIVEGTWVDEGRLGRLGLA